MCHAEVERARDEYNKLREQGSTGSPRGGREQDRQAEAWYAHGRYVINAPRALRERSEGGRQSEQNLVMSLSPPAPRFSSDGLDRLQTVWESTKNGDIESMESKTNSAGQQTKKLPTTSFSSRRSACPATTAAAPSAGAKVRAQIGAESNGIGSGAGKVPVPAFHMREPPTSSATSHVSLSTTSFPNDTAGVAKGHKSNLKSEIARVQELLAAEISRADVLEARARRREQHVALFNPQPQDRSAL